MISRNTVYIFVYCRFEGVCSVEMRFVENKTIFFKSSNNLTVTISGYSL